MKVITPREVPVESPPIIDLPVAALPESSSVLTYIVKMRRITPTEASGYLQPFARLSQSIIAIRGPRKPGTPSVLPQSLEGVLKGKEDELLILRDYSSNVKRMLQVLEKLEEK